jgi:hypothetical protein
MGAESDRLILDYLSKVGDLAQTALPADRRRELVARLREDIDRERRGSESPAVVRRILGRLGAPDEVVKEAAAVPAPRHPEPRAAIAPDPAPAEPEWWRLPDQRTHSPLRKVLPGDELAGLPGMTGGVTIPLTPEPEPEPGPEDEPGPEPESEAEPGAEAGAAPVKRRRRWWPGLLEAVAVLLLLAGAVLGSWIPLLAGWAVAYGSRRLSRRAARFAALGLPGLTAAIALIWLWGRFAGRWGEPIPEGGLDSAIAGALPTVVRIAAVASAAFLLWRGSRAGRPPG